MDRAFRLFPEQASTLAGEVDSLYFFLCSITLFFTILIFILIVYFAIKYRRRSEEPPPPVRTNMTLEIVWSVIPFIIVMIIFFWGARIYFRAFKKPTAAMNISVIGKQWMWKIQHPDGTREINELHVPAGQPIELTLASQDVIHSFFLPAFRIKMDAVPGRYTKISFVPTRPGVYPLFCAEYCGTQHSGMIGRVIVLRPEDYQTWLAGTTPAQPPHQAGQKLFTNLGCITCHGSVAPTMAGLYGSTVRLQTGQTTPADENYLRESILDSTAKITSGYAPIMPSYRGQLTEEQLMQLVAYIKSLEKPQEQRIQP